MKDIVEIKDQKGERIALIFRKSLKAENGIKFLTPEDYPLQLGLLERPKDENVVPHIHKHMKYDVDTTMEFIYVERGTVEAKFFNNDFDFLEKHIMTAGDFLLAISGGHSFDFLDDVRLIEVKQGPYPGDSYAKKFKE